MVWAFFRFAMLILFASGVCASPALAVGACARHTLASSVDLPSQAVPFDPQTCATNVAEILEYYGRTGRNLWGVKVLVLFPKDRPKFTAYEARGAQSEKPMETDANTGSRGRNVHGGKAQRQTHWQFHAVLLERGKIRDPGYRLSNSPVPLSEYFRNMFRTQLPGNEQMWVAEIEPDRFVDLYRQEGKRRGFTSVLRFISYPSSAQLAEEDVVKLVDFQPWLRRRLRR